MCVDHSNKGMNGVTIEPPMSIGSANLKGTLVAQREGHKEVNVIMVYFHPRHKGATRLPVNNQLLINQHNWTEKQVKMINQQQKL